jgi:hypothetical protein
LQAPFGVADAHRPFHLALNLSFSKLLLNPHRSPASPPSVALFAHG